VTSKALIEVTPELQGRSLEMALYAEFDPDDEFVEVGRAKFGPNTVPVPLPEEEREWILNFRRPKRIAEDQVIFSYAERAVTEINELAAERGEEPRYGPLYFIVGQRWVTWSTSAADGVPGPETCSPPTELGPVEIDVSGYDALEDGTISFRPTSDKIGLSMELRLRDQDFEYRDVAFTVTIGSWTGYFWINESGGRSIHVPVFPAAGSVSVKAQAREGITVESTFTLTPESGDMENFETRLTNANDSASEKLKGALEQAQSRTEGAREALGWLPDKIRELQEKYQRSPSSSDARELVKLMQSQVSYEHNLRLIPQVSIPRANAEFAITVAKAQKNWRMVVSRNHTLIALHELESQLEEQRRAASTQIHEWGKQQTDQTPAPAQQRRGPTEEERRRINFLDGVTEYYGAINRYAPLAGDVAAMQEVVLKWNDAEIEMARLRGDEKKIHDATRNAGGRLQDLGAHVACLTGDQEAGANLWIQGYEIRKPTEPTTDMLGNSRPVREWQELELPWWFPESKRRPAREDG